MKRLFTIITLFITLVGSVFAVDWKEYKTDKDEIGEYKVYFDFDATEPFELEKEDIRYIMNLQYWYDYTSIGLFKYYDDKPYAIGAKNNHYSTLMLNKDKPHVCECHVNKDGTVTMFFYKRYKGETIEDIMRKLSTYAFGEPCVRVGE